MKIEINNLSFSYKKLGRLIDHVDFTADSGDVVALIGHNGCGKTTFLKLICGFLFPDEGSVNIIGNHSDPVFSGILESPKFMNFMTGYENIKYYMAEYFDEKRVKSAFEEWGLEKAMNDNVSSYSLGMRKKLALLLAFETDSKIVVLDEPVSALDSESVKIFYSNVRKNAETGKIIIMTTHILYELERFCNRIYSFENGKLIESSLSADGVKYYILEFANEYQASQAAGELDKDEVCFVNGKEVIVSDVHRSISELLRSVMAFDLITVVRKES